MTRLLLATVALGASVPALAEPLTLAPHLASHMVVQHGEPIEFRGGGARPGEAVTVAFNGASAIGRAEASGRWQVILPPAAAGQGGTVTVRTASGEALRLDDVVAGDVWLCSGQSNMDLPIADSANPERTRRESSGVPIRILKLRRAAAAAPAAVIETDIAWSRAAPESVGGFSAACWHMAREILKHNASTPLGLIQASWGGSTIEDWMSPEALRAGGAPADDLALLARYAAAPAATLAAAVDATDRWAERVDPGSARSAWAADTLDTSEWSRIAVPGQWERSGIDGLGAFDGIMWFRTSVDLTAAEAAKPAMVQLGRIDERDRLWINGIPVGASLIAADRRSYRLPAGLLRAGANSVTVRVIDEMGGGGFSGPADALALVLQDGGRKSLAGNWLYRRGAADDAWTVPPPPIPWSMPRGLAMAWNGMIAPLAGVRLRGIAWYQGESNASRAAEYGASLRAWRTSWRAYFRNPALPVVLVQLPSYGPRSTRPVDAPWARLREVQRLAARDDAATGLTVAIDLGIPTDIHPAHKDVVGQRMGQEALRVAYRMPLPAPPQPVSAVRTPRGIEIALDPVGAGLDVTGAVEPTAFELCDSLGACRYARAKVVGRSVLVFDDGSPAVEVRYAWQGSPPVNLYARTGLPVTPFRMRITPGPASQ